MADAAEGSTFDDTVDRVRREWSRTYPDLDTSPIDVLGRIQRIASISNHRLDIDLARHGITRSEFNVLSAIARADAPLRASEVVSTTLLSGASITKIADALVSRGLMVREKSARDGRVVLMTLTDAGRAVVDDALPRRLADDERLIAGLSTDERQMLTTLLRKVCGALGE